MRSDSIGNVSSFHGNIAINTMQTASMADGPDYFDNVNFNDYIHQDDIQFDFNNIDQFKKV